MKKIFFIALSLVLSFSAFAQKYTITGYISDAESGEKLIGANVYDANSYLGTSTNKYGFFSLTLNSGKININVSYVGYANFSKEIELTNDQSINIELKSAVEIEEVLVEGKVNEGGVRSSQMSVVEIPIKTIKNLPALLGETDIIKSVQLLPGVQSGSEGMSGLYVRGGGPDQNLILLDGVPVYNVNHLFGFFSVFNADAVHNVKLVKGGFPARYGGRLSSVLDISMKEGNIKEFKGTASIGLISSKLAYEGPIGKKTSFIVSGRRTYVDILAMPIIKVIEKIEDFDKLRFGYFFHDFNAKINHKFSDKSRLYLSAYTGKDKFYTKIKESGFSDDKNWSYEQRMKMWWGNITGAARWNYMISNKLFSNTTATVSRYKMLVGSEMLEDEKLSGSFEYSSGIVDYSGSIDFDYFPIPNHNIKFGLINTYHTYNPGISVAKYLNENNSEEKEEYGNGKIYANEIGAYFEDDIRIGALLKVNAGLRLSGFYVKKKFYNGIEPRISARYLVNDKLSIKASYAKMHQYINLLTNSNIGLPTDLWLPSTEKVRPQVAQQVALGSVYSLNKDIDISIEGFYKKMNNLIEYKEGANFFSIEQGWEEKVTQGTGWSKGIEFMLRKKYGSVTGWIGYTLSKSDRLFNTPGEEISFGNKFPYKFDRRHDVSIVLTYKINERIDIGATWVYGTGNAVTLGYETYQGLPNQENDYNSIPKLTYINARNNYRMPAYHRLDFGINFTKERKRGTRVINLSVYNLYNRQNPFFLRWGYDMYGGDSSQKKLYQYSLFPIIPSISYKFNF